MTDAQRIEALLAAVDLLRPVNASFNHDSTTCAHCRMERFHDWTDHNLGKKVEGATDKLLGVARQLTARLTTNTAGTTGGSDDNATSNEGSGKAG